MPRLSLPPNNGNNDNSSLWLPGALPTLSLILPAALHGKYYLILQIHFIYTPPRFRRLIGRLCREL